MFSGSAINGRGTVALQHLGLALVGIIVIGAAELSSKTSGPFWRLSGRPPCRPECGLRSQFSCRFKVENFQPRHVLFLDGLAFR